MLPFLPDFWFLDTDPADEVDNSVEIDSFVEQVWFD
jgi:hypothetical protein